MSPGTNGKGDTTLAARLGAKSRPEGLGPLSNGVSSADHLFVVPADSVQRIQEAQTTIYHPLWELTLNELTTGRARSGTSRATPGRSWSRGS